MKPPKSVRVAGHEYSIEWMPKRWRDKEQKHGDCEVAELELRVCDDQRAPETLLHEVIHAIYYEYGCSEDDEEEEMVGKIGNGLSQVLRAHPEVVAYITRSTSNIG